MTPRAQAWRDLCGAMHLVVTDPREAWHQFGQAYAWFMMVRAVSRQPPRRTRLRVIPGDKRD